MRFAWLTPAIVACVSPRAAPNDASPVDAPGPSVDAAFIETRQATSVVVGARRVAWSQAVEPCPLEGGPDCPGVGPTVSTAELETATPTTWIADREGAWNIVGDEDELFVRIGSPFSGGYLARLRPSTGGAVEPMTTIRWWLSPPAVDATHLYWQESEPNGAPMLLRRALRIGDGSDAVTIATGAIYAKEMATLAGYVWWTSDALYRVPVEGGSPEIILPDGQISGATDSALYVTRSVEVTPTGPWEYQLVVVTGDGASSILIDHIVQQEGPEQVVVSGDELFWRGLNQHLYRTPLAGGAVTEVPDAGYGVFALTPDAILVDFTRAGYRSIPR